MYWVGGNASKIPNNTVNPNLFDQLYNLSHVLLTENDAAERTTNKPRSVTDTSFYPSTVCLCGAVSIKTILVNFDDNTRITVSEDLLDVLSDLADIPLNEPVAATSALSRWSKRYLRSQMPLCTGEDYQFQYNVTSME